MAASTKIFGDKLREARERAYLTQATLGEMLGGLTDENVGRIERAKKPVGIHTKRLPLLAKALGMTMEQVKAGLVAPARKSDEVLVRIPRPVYERLCSVAAALDKTPAEWIAISVSPARLIEQLEAEAAPAPEAESRPLLDPQARSSRSASRKR